MSGKQGGYVGQAVLVVLGEIGKRSRVEKTLMIGDYRMTIARIGGALHSAY